MRAKTSSAPFPVPILLYGHRGTLFWGSLFPEISTPNEHGSLHHFPENWGMERGSHAEERL